MNVTVFDFAELFVLYCCGLPWFFAAAGLLWLFASCLVVV